MVQGLLIRRVLLPEQVRHKGRRAEAKAGEHVARVEAHREQGVLAPSLALRPRVTEKFRHVVDLDER